MGPWVLVVFLVSFYYSKGNILFRICRHRTLNSCHLFSLPPTLSSLCRNLPAILDWVKTQKPGATGVNIITSDFVDLVDFATTVIELNDLLEEDRALAKCWWGIAQSTWRASCWSWVEFERFPGRKGPGQWQRSKRRRAFCFPSWEGHLDKATWLFIAFFPPNVTLTKFKSKGKKLLSWGQGQNLPSGL